MYVWYALLVILCTIKMLHTYKQHITTKLIAFFFMFVQSKSILLTDNKERQILKISKKENNENTGLLSIIFSPH